MKKEDLQTGLIDLTHICLVAMISEPEFLERLKQKVLDCFEDKGKGCASETNS